MRIAIYGDSFAVSKLELSSSWYSLLGKKLNSQVDSYGENGSSVYYSYKKFMESHIHYDRVIFLVTEPSRYYSHVKLTNGDTLHVPGINEIEWMRTNSNLNSVDLDTLDDIEAWYRVTDESYTQDMTALMLDKIESIREVLFVPCFPTSFSATRVQKEGKTISLMELVFRQFELLNRSVEYDLITRENPEVISAHFGPEFNEFLANVVYNRMITGEWDFSEYKNVTLRHNTEYYYRIQEAI